MTRALFVLALLLAPAFARADEAPPPDNACFDAAVVGQKAQKSGELAKARAAFLRCAQAACPAEVTARCTNWVTEVDAAMPSVLVAAQDERGADILSGVITLDGTSHPETFDGQPVALEPGSHTVRLEVAGHALVEQSIVLREHEKNRRVVLRLTPVARRPIHPFILGGIGIAVAIAGGVLATVGIVDRQNARCDVGCAPGDFDRVHAELVSADVAFSVGAAFVVVAIVDYFVSRPKSPASAHGALPFGVRF